VNPCKNYYPSVGLGRDLGQAQGITGVIGDLLDLVPLVIVGQKDSIPLLKEISDLAFEGFIAHLDFPFIIGCFR